MIKQTFLESDMTEIGSVAFAPATVTEIPRAKLDTRVPAIVRIENGALEESSDGTIVLRGVVAPQTLRFLKVEENEYQRKLENRPDIFEALKAGIVLPDIDLGVRGTDFKCDGDDYLISAPVYIIDGWQRVGTALALLDLFPNFNPRIGALLQFGTDRSSEAIRFTNLNLNRKAIKPSKHLFNLRDQNAAVLTLVGLSKSPSFPLFGKICWEQSMKRGELLTALTVTIAVCALHAHKAPMRGRRVKEMAAMLDVVARKIGLPKFRHNVSTFFSLIDECFGLRSIEYRHAAPHIKSPFLFMMARVLSRHLNFWEDDGRLLKIEAATRKKIAAFPLDDPQIKALAGSAGKASDILFEMMVKHINSGRREHRLQSRFE